MMANTEVQKQVYWLASHDMLVTVNKLTEDLQQARIDKGLDPKLRPVNKPSLWWKFSTAIGMRHPQVKKTKKRIENIQMGIGAPFGMPRITHTAYERYKQGWCILANDAANGFNEADRFKMLEAVKRYSPALAHLF